MLNEILGDYPQIKVIDYLLMNPFAELSKLQIAVGSEISRITLNNFIDDLENKKLIIKKSNSKYIINLESPIIIQLNMLLDELNRISMENAMNELDEPYVELNDKQLSEIFDENSPDVDLLKLENDILIEENYDVYIVENSNNYVILVWGVVLWKMIVFK